MHIDGKAMRVLPFVVVSFILADILNRAVLSAASCYANVYAAVA